MRDLFVAGRTTRTFSHLGMHHESSFPIHLLRMAVEISLRLFLLPTKLILAIKLLMILFCTVKVPTVLNIDEHSPFLLFASCSDEIDRYLSLFVVVRQENGAILPLERFEARPSILLNEKSLQHVFI